MSKEIFVSLFQFLQYIGTITFASALRVGPMFRFSVIFSFLVGRDIVLSFRLIYKIIPAPLTLLSLKMKIEATCGPLFNARKKKQYEQQEKG